MELKNIADIIVKYKMNELESKAYRISMMWEEQVKQEFPDFKHMKLKRTGDPRTSMLFKLCYKLARETIGLLEDSDYKFYITAQLHVLKAYYKQNDLFIDAQCLIGEKAWIRWKMWKYKYDKIFKEKTTEEEIKPRNSLIETEFVKTRNFLQSKIGEINESSILKELENGNLSKWIAFGKIHPLFVLMFNCLKNKAIDIYGDVDLYKNMINDDVQKIFNSYFPTTL